MLASDCTIRDMKAAGAGANKAPIRLGASDPERIPVPEDDDEMSPGRKRAPDVQEAQGGGKRERAGTVTLDVNKIRELLREQSQEIMAHRTRLPSWLQRFRRWRRR